jgi:hypothetical protein
MKQQDIVAMLGAMVLAAKLDNKRVVYYIKYPEATEPERMERMYSVECYLAKNGSVRWMLDGRCINRAYLAVRLREAEAA